MIEAWLFRNLPTPDGTFGVFCIPEKNWCCYSLELPWRHNQSRISCIPHGDFDCRWTLSNRLGRKTYQVENVTNRSGIRFHPGNYAKDTTGCVLLGNKIAIISGKKMLSESGLAVSAFESLLDEQSFKLRIRWEEDLI